MLRTEYTSVQQKGWKKFGDQNCTNRPPIGRKMTLRLRQTTKTKKRHIDNPPLDIEVSVRLPL